MRKTIVSFGEILWDLLPGGAKLGGAPLNFACRAGHLGDRAVMVSRLGRDEAGRKAFERIRHLDMETIGVQWDDDHPTGTVEVSFEADGDPDYVIIPDVAYDYTEATDELIALASSADCVCFGTLAQRAPVARRSCRRILEAADRAEKLLDINLRKDCYSRETVTDSLGRADVLKLNDAEGRELAGAFDIRADGLDAIGKALLGRFDLSCCVITLGERGSLAVSADGEKTYVPGFEVELVDSVGSGDAFTAGFVHKRLRGAALAECCRYGNAAGAIVATQRGATAPLTGDDIERFLAAGPPRVACQELAPFAVE